MHGRLGILNKKYEVEGKDRIGELLWRKTSKKNKEIRVKHS